MAAVRDTKRRAAVAITTAATLAAVLGAGLTAPAQAAPAKAGSCTPERPRRCPEATSSR
ncbi:hypothetical protein SSPS47_02950 [Streptomyces sp. S4.7]|nr:hypothetical protein SSPS47_02950 [Streptomyces sp. S4.7]